MDLKKYIRDIPDFPKKGIIFKDITPLLKDPKAFAEVTEIFARRYKDKKIDLICCVESRGFVFGAALALKLGCGFIPIRKKGKLPYKTFQETYELEYGTDTLEIHQDAIKTGDRVLILDDLLATGGTVSAVARMVEKLKGTLVDIAFVIELTNLRGRDKLGRDCFSLIQY